MPPEAAEAENAGAQNQPAAPDAQQSAPAGKPAQEPSKTAEQPQAQRAEEPRWTKERAAQERRAFLRELGFESEEQAKAVREAEAARIEASKTLEQKLAEAAAEKTTLASRLQEMEQAVKVNADSVLQSLTQEQQAAVAAITGGDPSRVISAVNALRPTWAAQAAERQAAEQQSATTSAASGPTAADTSSTVDHKAEYQRLRKENPVAAAEYRFAHFREVTGG